MKCLRFAAKVKDFNLIKVDTNQERPEYADQLQEDACSSLDRNENSYNFGE
jgi:hypothetical protein